MTTIVTATLNGRPCIEAELHHRAGAKPSTATVIMRADDGEQVARGPATLVLGDGASRVEFTSLDVTSVQTDAGIARVILADRRRGWNARVSGERKDKTLGQLVAELTKSLGERSGIANLARASETAAAQRWDDALASNAIEALLAQFGQSLVVAPDGTLAAVSNDAISLDDLPVISCEVAEVTTPGVRVMAPRVLQEAEITGEWEPVCEDESGALRPLAELLTAWGISDADVRKACLFDGGLRKLVGDATKAALLERFAYRCYRIPEAERDKLPLVAKRLNADNKLIAERVEHTGFRLKGRDVPALDDPYETQTPLTPAAGYVFDGVAGTVLFDHVVGHLEPARPPVHDTRLEGRTLKEAPEIKLTASYRSGPALEVLRRNGEGNGDIQVYRGELQGLRKANQTSSTPVNQTKLANDAAFVHERFLRALPTQKLSAKIAGAYTVGPAPYGEVLIRCNDSDGLITEIIPPHDPVRLLADAFATPPDALPSVSAAIGEEPPVTKHANAYHTGPLVLRVDRGVNESEAFIAARAKKVDPKDGHLTLDQLGPLREPFHLPNIAATKAGGWFLAAPIRVTDDGVRLLSDSETIAKDFDAIDTQSLGEGKVPHGTDGLLLQGLDGETYLALYDRPLVAQHRGNDVADYSVEVREIDGDELDAIKRGGTHFPLVVSLSYSHMQAGVGGTQASPGWAPTLNFKDYQTGTKRDFQLAGRGLFTEQRGLHLGRLAHLPLQGGPVMADAARCTKHRYGVAAGPDGMYYESAGHISTEAFFKVPGDETFDAPFSFSKELTSVGAGQGVEFQAEIKLHAEMQHAWNKRTVPHRWVITYRWPVYDSVPPVWTPREDPPYVMEKNLAAPSFDFVPPPSTGEPPYAIPMPEPTINMTGYAPELKPGVPDPSLGGGCVYFPSDVHLKDGAPWASGGPTRYVVLHPKVCLGFGLPSLSGDGGSVSGVRMGLDGNDALFIQPVDASGNPAPGKATTIKGPLALDSVPTPGAPATGAFWNDNGAGALPAGVHVQQPSGPVLIGSGGSSDEDTLDVTQAAHGFVVGSVVYFDQGSSAWAAADAGTVNKEGVGIVEAATTNSFTVRFSGPIDGLSAITDDDGNGLSAGWYVISDTIPGKLRNPDGLQGAPNRFVPALYMFDGASGSVQFRTPQDISGVDDIVLGPTSGGTQNAVPVFGTSGFDLVNTPVTIDPGTALLTIPAGGRMSLPDGTAGTPSLFNTGDADTGVNFPAEDEVALSAGGINVLVADDNLGGTGQYGVNINGVYNRITGTIDLSGANPAFNLATIDENDSPYKAHFGEIVIANTSGFTTTTQSITVELPDFASVGDTPGCFVIVKNHSAGNKFSTPVQVIGGEYTAGTISFEEPIDGVTGGVSLAPNAGMLFIRVFNSWVTICC